MSSLKNTLIVIAIAFCGTVMANEPTAVFVGQLDLSEMVITSPQGYSAASRNFVLTDDEAEKLQSRFQDSVARAFSKNSEYVLVDNESLADVSVDTRVLEMNPTAPKDDFRSRKHGQKFVTRGAGSIKFQYTLSKQGEYEVVLENKTNVGNNWDRNNRMTNARWVRQMLNASGVQLLKSIIKREA